MFVQALTAFAVTAVLLLMLTPLARLIGLVDHPDERKQHQGQIPLIGGLAIFFAILLLLPWFSSLRSHTYWYLAAAGLLVAIGIIDDKFNVSVVARVIVEVVAASMMIYGGDIWVSDLGNLLGFREIHMPLWLSAPFTVIAVFGVINAWNMIDGMDGLAGLITLVAFGSFYFLTHTTATESALPALMMGGVASYLLFNLGNNRLLPKVFLGDAGSKLIGFTLVWLLIDATQGGQFTGLHMPAPLALYVVGLPLIDMVVTTVRRIRKGHPPFKPDRTHIHHVLEHAGFSRQEILILVGVFSVQINFIGALMYFLQWAAYVQFFIFCLLTLLYHVAIEHAWKLGKLLQSRLRK